MRPLDEYIRRQLNEHATKIGEVLEADVMAIVSPIVPGLEISVRDAVALISKRKDTLAIEMKQNRAEEIAETLGDNERWHSHGRGINMRTLIDELNLKIEDYSEIPGLGPLVKEYYELLQDYMAREQIISFVHTKEYF